MEEGGGGAQLLGQINIPMFLGKKWLENVSLYLLFFLVLFYFIYGFMFLVRFYFIYGFIFLVRFYFIYGFII